LSVHVEFHPFFILDKKFESQNIPVKLESPVEVFGFVVDEGNFIEHGVG
jgi:hypothetical protein